jgi:hypothetical protein
MGCLGPFLLGAHGGRYLTHTKTKKILPKIDPRILSDSGTRKKKKKKSSGLSPITTIYPPPTQKIYHT